MLSPNSDFAALADAAPSSVWIAAPDGTITLTNRSWRTAFGAPPERGAPLLSATTVHPDDFERCRGLWDAALREGVDYEATARHRTAQGTYRHFLTCAVPLTSAAGDLVAWFGTTTDVEREFSEAGASGSTPGVAPARHEGDLSAELLSTASHEIRSPLAVLLGTVQLARRRAAIAALSAAQVTEALDSIEQQAARALRLIEQLLDHSRLELGRLRLERSECDLSELTRRVAAAMAQAHDSHHIELRASRPCLAEIDAARIEQVLFNLVDNAVKFSPAGSRIEITVTRRDPSSGTARATPVVEIAVRDRGRGVPPTERALIFERFHQVAADDATTGLGLGLAVSKEIVELHGGTVSLGTPRGGGTRFVVRLPITPPINRSSRSRVS